MNPVRFVRKCFFDHSAATTSVKLVFRLYYGMIFWWLFPDSPVKWKHPTGAKLALHRNHSFTKAFWPAVEAYEPDLQSAFPLLLSEGDVFVDCGANVGLFSVLASKIVGPKGRVISLEPNPVTFEILTKNLDGESFCEAFNLAAGHKLDVVSLYVPSEGDVYGTLKPNQYVSKDSPSIKVKVEPLDMILERCGVEKVNVIKIDVEGSEMDVLSGADKSIQKYLPVIIVEYSTQTWPAYGKSYADLVKFALSNRYEMHVFDTEAGGFRRAISRDGNSSYSNIILLPAS